MQKFCNKPQKQTLPAAVNQVTWAAKSQFTVCNEHVYSPGVHVKIASSISM